MCEICSIPECKRVIERENSTKNAEENITDARMFMRIMEHMHASMVEVKGDPVDDEVTDEDKEAATDNMLLSIETDYSDEDIVSGVHGALFLDNMAGTLAMALTLSMILRAIKRTKTPNN